MKFGNVINPENIDFSLPEDHPNTAGVLEKYKDQGLDEISVGCAKWNRQDLKSFYPRGTKDELAYYASQFNSIELNATFYSNYGPEQIIKWRDKTPDDFRFFPKVSNYISHIKRLNEVEMPIKEFCDNIRCFDEKLGMAFLQLHNNFAPKNKDRLFHFLEIWPKDIPLAVELRHTDWFNDEKEAEDLYAHFEKNETANIITDTAGRRDLLHMRLTSPVAFVRYVGANHESDFLRLDDWVERIVKWKSEGLTKLYFFVHQNLETSSPYLSAYFIQKLNKALGLNMRKPENIQTSLDF